MSDCGCSACCSISACSPDNKEGGGPEPGYTAALGGLARVQSWARLCGGVIGGCGDSCQHGEQCETAWEPLCCLSAPMQVGNTALHLAAERGNYGLVELLLRARCDVDAANQVI